MSNLQIYQPTSTQPDSFNGYTRTLTARGGFLMEYRDWVRNGFLNTLRMAVVASGILLGIWAERTWKQRLNIPAELRFISLKEGPSGPASYALILNLY